MPFQNDQPMLVLHIVHGSFSGPFVELARAYNSLIKSTLPHHKIVTVFLKGAYNREVEGYINSDHTIFMDASRAQRKGNQKFLANELRRRYQRDDFALCIAHRSKATRFALRYFSCPVFSVHHAFGDYDKFIKRLFLKPYKKRLTMIGVSNSVTRELSERFPRWPCEQFQTIYNRINVNEFEGSLLDREKARNKLNIPLNDWVIGHVARLHPSKDQSTLIRGFARAEKSLPSCTKLFIAGNGSEELALKKLVDELGITHKVIFHGYLKQAKCYFKAFDCFVLSSIKESFGMVLLESMVAGTPCIVSDSGGPREVIGESHYIFSPRDESRLSDLIIEMNKKGPEHSHAQTKLRLIENFSDEAVVNTFDRLLFSRGIKT